MGVTEHKKKEPEIQEGCQGLAMAARVCIGFRDGAGAFALSMQQKSLESVYSSPLTPTRAISNTPPDAHLR